MTSKLLSSLVAGSLILSSSVAAAQVGGAPVQPAAEAGLGSNGESRLGEGTGDVDATTGIVFGLIVFLIAVFVNRGGDEDNNVVVPTSP